MFLKLVKNATFYGCPCILCLLNEFLKDKWKWTFCVWNRFWKIAQNARFCLCFWNCQKCHFLLMSVFFVFFILCAKLYDKKVRQRLTCEGFERGVLDYAPPNAFGLSGGWQPGTGNQDKAQLQPFSICYIWTRVQMHPKKTIKIQSSAGNWCWPQTFLNKKCRGAVSLNEYRC